MLGPFDTIREPRVSNHWLWTEKKRSKEYLGSGGIRTHALENQKADRPWERD
jgi:hypothetical protein